MSLFSTNLLLHILRGIVEEIERIDPKNPALVQLQRTIGQKSAELTGWCIIDNEPAHMVGAA